MAASELIEALQALAHERKIDEFYLIERLEASLLIAISAFLISNMMLVLLSTVIRARFMYTSLYLLVSPMRKLANILSSKSAT